MNTFFEHGKNERNEIAPCGAVRLEQKLSKIAIKFIPENYFL